MTRAGQSAGRSGPENAFHAYVVVVVTTSGLSSSDLEGSVTERQPHDGVSRVGDTVALLLHAVSGSCDDRAEGSEAWSEEAELAVSPIELEMMLSDCAATACLVVLVAPPLQLHAMGSLQALVFAGEYLPDHIAFS